MSQQLLPVFYFGDSHVRYFTRAARLGLFSPYEARGIEVGGATAVGMRNPNAKTNAIGQFRNWIRDKPRESIVVVHLGEVDCGFVIWYRAMKYGESIELQMQQSIAAYFEFVDELRALGFSKIIITGATLPTITDEDRLGEVVEKRSSISATQQERTILTLKYNQELEKAALARGLVFTDIVDHVLDSSTGLVASYMRNHDPSDHHMEGNRAAVFWAARLNQCIRGYQPVELTRRTWRAARSTFIKAYPAHSGRVPSVMLRSIAEGDVLEGDVVSQNSEFALLSNITLNGVLLPAHLRFMHIRHWSSQVLG